MVPLNERSVMRALPLPTVNCHSRAFCRPGVMVMGKSGSKSPLKVLTVTDALNALVARTVTSPECASKR